MSVDVDVKAVIDMLADLTDERAREVVMEVSLRDEHDRLCRDAKLLKRELEIAYEEGRPCRDLISEAWAMYECGFGDA